MYKYLHLDFPLGTKKEPHLYLNTMARPDYIALLQLYFFNEHKNQDSAFSSYDINVNVADELLILNYEKEICISEFESRREWKSVTYRFEDSLDSTLRIEQLNFIRNLDLRFDRNGGYEPKSITAFILKLIGIIADRYTDIETLHSHQKYISSFKKFFSAIAKKIKDDYCSFLPKKINPVFTALLSIKFNDQPLEPAYLQISIFDAIKELKDQKKRLIFKIEHPDTAKTKFKHLIYSQPEMVQSPILVTANFPYISTAKYLISRICFYIGIYDNSFHEMNLFNLNDKPFTVNSTYTAKTRVNADKKAVKKMIDDLIQSHIS